MRTRRMVEKEQHLRTYAGAGGSGRRLVSLVEALAITYSGEELRVVQAAAARAQISLVTYVAGAALAVAENDSSQPRDRRTDGVL